MCRHWAGGWVYTLAIGSAGERGRGHRNVLRTTQHQLCAWGAGVLLCNHMAEGSGAQRGRAWPVAHEDIVGRAGMSTQFCPLLCPNPGRGCPRPSRAAPQAIPAGPQPLSTLRPPKTMGSVMALGLAAQARRVLARRLAAPEACPLAVPVVFLAFPEGLPLSCPGLGSFPFMSFPSLWKEGGLFASLFREIPVIGGVCPQGPGPFAACPGVQ